MKELQEFIRFRALETDRTVEVRKLEIPAPTLLSRIRGLVLKGKQDLIERFFDI